MFNPSKSKDKARSRRRNHPAVQATVGIYFGIFAAYLFLFSGELWNGEHQFHPATVRGLAVIGLIALGCAWWEKWSQKY